MSADQTKAVAAYVRLAQTPRERLAEVDLRQLEQAELVMRELNGLELVEILRKNTLRLP